MRVLTIAVAAIIAASGCSNHVHARPADTSQERRAQCTADKVNCLDECMPNPQWAVIPVIGWIYVPGSEYLCQSHCDRAEAACWLHSPDPSAVEAAN